MTTLCEKYRPSCFADVRGQDEAIFMLRKFLKEFPIKKAIIFNGPPGTGKTSLAHALSKENQLEIIELNASDLRNREQLDRILKQASQQASLFEKSKVILVDEVDGLSHEDRGGLPELLQLIEETKFPLILTSNNIWDKKFSSLRRKANILALKDLSYITLVKILKEIAEKENIIINEEVLKIIAIKSKGDARAAINDLETVKSINTAAGIREEVIELAERDKEVDIFQTLRNIFKNPVSKETLGVYDKTNLSLDEIFLWLDENIPLEYTGEELFKAYNCLSLADLFRGRIYRQQHWRFLVYQNIFLSAGVSSAKSKIKTNFTKYKKPTRILKIWLINQKQKHKKSIAGKLSKHLHIGQKRAMKEIPILIQVLKTQQLQKKLDLSDKEIEFIQKYN